ncbi:CPBP family intramembrane glutamic endopeptidase [Singulisphaera sp. GP187]|uniref:CPBP family intramembrane glutamic endopeptidase n=1 Tax=Singulisphaera sp. GP187 TaxID=1882752 RepID=UPI0009414E28|nr:CPBP family intramembrane glutamic endopeptidase [Singulisphaera sp. GP187]
MRTSTRRVPPPPARRRSRFGYDHRWWGETEGTAVEDRRSYWTLTRRPLPCLAFVTPILLTYEFGVLWLGGKSAASYRTGADAWMRHVLAGVGLTDHWFLPFCLIIALLAWHATNPRDWKFRPSSLMGMAFESVLLAVALVGLSRVVDIGFTCLEHAPTVVSLGAEPSAQVHPAAPLIGFLGAGVYEEALFRLALVPFFFGVLRLLQTPTVLASSIAVTTSALLFSLAHHAGSPGETFTWFAFIFRWLAGVYFAWVFVVRGFGVAVGTHSAYDVLVGWIGWHL